MSMTCVFGSAQEEIDDIRQALTSEFKMMDLGSVSSYLGLKTTRDILASKRFLTGTLYIERSLNAVGCSKLRALALGW